MTVVINEFEVVPEVPERRPAEAVAAPQEERPAPPPAAQEIERIARHLAERGLRVWAG